jgi:hypothetical protein
MPEPDPVSAAFREAAIDWAAGGRGQPLVDAAAEALAQGLDSPSLRLLAGAIKRTSDEEASELAPATFAELGLDVPVRLSTEAVIAGARRMAMKFAADPVNPRAFARDMWRMYVQAQYDSELDGFAGFDDYYDLLEQGVIAGSVLQLDADLLEAARAFVEGREPVPISLGMLIERNRPRSFGVVRRLLRRLRPGR